MNRSFDEKLSREHFVVRVGEINVDGVWGVHPYNADMVSFYSMSHIISIHEEVELDPSNPEHAEMIKEYEKKTGQKIEPDLGKLPKTKVTNNVLPVLDKAPMPKIDESSDTGDSTFVDIANLEKLAENTRRSFDSYDNFNLRKH
jgi:hypothetical protein